MPMSLLQFHQLAAPRGDGLRPEFLLPRPLGILDRLPVEELGEEQRPRPVLQIVKPRSS